MYQGVRGGERSGITTSKEHNRSEHHHQQYQAGQVSQEGWEWLHILLHYCDNTLRPVLWNTYPTNNTTFQGHKDDWLGS
ncbi:hypothetical protein E2C01_005391 [Portunus trituberculatus]|uniref:Uncharacterized protein n=1 Tax=Portunus trituberculatus TaxID=210409 RepID=A0A5B7CSD9_PORTR|nr:hypothetical protein [Portunus trituberculatus]